MIAGTVITKELLRKYNVAGPRYTSYPTVPYWETSPTPADWVNHLSRAIQTATAQGTGAAIYVHIPFCESLCTYCGCNTRITRNHGVSEPYIDTLLKEFALYRSQLGIEKLLLTELHLGGGTPTFFSPAELSRFLEGLLHHCTLTSDHELSIEVDPRVTTRDHLTVLREFGFKRISMGIQDFDPKVQEIVHRIQSVDSVKKLTEDARELGFTSVNFDLIYGLPLQTLSSIKTTIDAVRLLRPDRIAFYAYAHVPWIKPSQRRFTERDLPEGNEKRALYELGREMLESCGYSEIGMDHFALGTDSLSTAVQFGSLHRNFMGYTARQVNPVLALGVSAIGDAWTAFAQNEKLLETYVARVEEGIIPVMRGHVLDTEDQVLRRHVLNVMTKMQTSWASDDLNVPFLADLHERLGELERDQLIELSPTQLNVKPYARAFLRNVAMAFDARLSRKQPGTQLFSQTI